MEITTIAGLVIGFVCIIVSVQLDGSFMEFIDAASIFIVFGGVIGATVMSFPMSTLKSAMTAMGYAFKARNTNLDGDIDMIIDIANTARRDGILALEARADTIEDPFLKKGLMLIVDGSNPELVRSIMETDLEFLSERHGSAQGVLLQMSSYSPAFGMIGTLIGLINMLKSLSDMDSLGPNMAVALITTFYGVVLANLVFTPMAKKLKLMSDDEYMRKVMMLEGLLSIQEGDNPRIIREKLNAFLSNSQVRNIQQKTQQETRNQDEN